jgi:hypothetical protein
MVGSDYTHGDSSMEYEFPRLLRERADRRKFSNPPCTKYSTTTPRRFTVCNLESQASIDKVLFEVIAPLIAMLEQQFGTEVVGFSESTPSGLEVGL